MRRATLTYNDTYYIPAELILRMQSSPEGRKEVRAEYTRLRDIAQKRLKRLKAAGMEETETYRRNYAHYKTLKEIKSDYELAGRLSDLARFVKAERSTVSGQREIKKKSIQTLKEHGYEGITQGNFDTFADFMQEYKDSLLDMEYDSGDAVDLYSIVVKHKLDPEKVMEDFEWWLENLETAKSFDVAKGAKKKNKTKMIDNTTRFEARIERKNAFRGGKRK